MATTSDIKRLKFELRTIWQAIYDDLADEHPGLPKRELKDRTRTKFLAVVDEAAREVAAEA